MAPLLLLLVIIALGSLGVPLVASFVIAAIGYMIVYGFCQVILRLSRPY